MDGTQDILDSCAARIRGALPYGARQGAARDASIYLAHTEFGANITRIAKASGAHPSTVSRAIRRVEQRREDPVYDCLISGAIGPAGQDGQEKAGAAEEGLRRDARRFLRRLSEPGAFLLVAEGALKAGVFCAANGYRRPIAMLPIATVAEFARREWIAAFRQGEASVRYRVTEIGRAFLRRELAVKEGARHGPGMAEAPSPFAAQHREAGERLFADPETGRPLAREVNLRESPVGWLARRKGPDGKPFLAPEEVDAADRLRSDFEQAQIGPSVTQDWRKFLTPGARGAGASAEGGSSDARERVGRALAMLGPGLADVALRTCCFLEGLEGCERRLGWSARSGKVVLKLALQRLADHYDLAPFKS